MSYLFKCFKAILLCGSYGELSGRHSAPTHVTLYGVWTYVSVWAQYFHGCWLTAAECMWSRGSRTSGAWMQQGKAFVGVNGSRSPPAWSPAIWRKLSVVLCVCVSDGGKSQFDGLFQEQCEAEPLHTELILQLLLIVFSENKSFKVEVCRRASWCPLCVSFCSVTYSVIIHKCLGSSCGCTFPMCEALDHVLAWDVCGVCSPHSDRESLELMADLVFQTLFCKPMKSMTQLWKGSCKNPTKHKRNTLELKNDGKTIRTNQK